jgi:N-acyl homoserine lactone hydrolase
MSEARPGMRAIVTASLALGLCNCAATGHETHVSALGVPRSSSAMEAHLDEPGAVDLETVAAADWAVPLSGLINLDNPKARAAGLVDHDEPIQIYFHALRHPARGTFIVDTGVERALRDDPGSSAMSGLIRWQMKFDHLVVHADTASWLAAQKQPLAGVFFTHLHVDHIAGLRDVPITVPLYTGAGEAGDSKLLNMFVRGSTNTALEGRASLQEWPSQKDPDGRFEAVTDVFGDEMVWAIRVPGHTSGSTAYLVRTPKGPVLMTGDACHTRWGWDNGVEPGTFSSDIEASKRSLTALRSLVARHPTISVRLGHQR